MGQPRQEEDRVERHPKQGKEAEAEADKVADGPEGETGPKPGKPHKAEGTWKVVMEATAEDLERKWDRLLLQTTVVRNDGEWPHGFISKGEDVDSCMRRKTHTPEVVIVDGGATCTGTWEMLRARRLKLWGRWKAVTVWFLMGEQAAEVKAFRSLKELAGEVDAALQRRMTKAYGAVGAQRFKWEVREGDFHINKINGALALRNHEEWGESLTTTQLDAARFWDWPMEPATSPEPLKSATVSGVEVAEKLTAKEETERKTDYTEWVREGQTWWGAMVPAAKSRVRRYLDQNRSANETVAKAVEANEAAGATGPPYVDVGEDGSNEVRLAPEDYRPGARGRIWTWVSGKCTECVPRSLADEIDAAEGYSTEQIQKIAEAVDFPDRRAVQMLTTTGATHGTVDFPLESYAGRNHQGSAVHHAIVTKMMAQKERDGHFEGPVQKANGSAAATHPLYHPFGVVPMGGTVQRQKDLEAYEMERDGQDVPKNVRGTYNGSFPHDGTSPNDHCDQDPETSKPWVTMPRVVQGVNILRNIGAPTVKAFKLDLKAAYTQLFHQSSQRWRQIIFWKWLEKGEWRGGYLHDVRMEWGMAYSGTVFHRAVTSLMVRWVEKALREEWAPKIKCRTTREWMLRRLEMGLDRTQGVPGMVQGFLDDFWIFAAGSEEDIALAREVVMEAFRKAGFLVSASKLRTEGSMAETVVILGHDIDIASGTRGVTAYKQTRMRDQAAELGDAQWHRKKLEQWLGLAQAIRGDVRRKWSLAPLYKLLRGEGPWVRPSKSARRALKRVLETLDERKSLIAVPTRWVIPTAQTVANIVNTDASSLEGLGGVMVTDETLYYFSQKWSEEIRRGRIVDGERRPLVDIAVLEALTVIVAASTWGHLWSCRKIAMRSDSSPTCFAFNKLGTKDPAMMRVVELWEEVQFFFGFEGLMVHVAGVDNDLSDRASRWENVKVQAGMEAAAAREPNITITKCVRVPPKWEFGEQSCAVMKELIGITGKSIAKRETDQTASLPSPPPPYRQPTKRKRETEETKKLRRAERFAQPPLQIQ